MARKLSKREISYYQQRKTERGEWEALKKSARAKCDALSDLDELTDAAREFLIADMDLYVFDYGSRAPEIVAKLKRRANSPAYCRTWAIWQLADRLKKQADDMRDMTPDERASYEARSAAEAKSLSIAHQCHDAEHR